MPCRPCRRAANCRSTCASGAHIVISFKDEGVGISEEIAEKIWDPFFTAKEKGTGLGLGIVKKIIETHQGQDHI
jgi:two-component system sensor histidine kinase HydH